MAVRNTRLASFAQHQLGWTRFTVDPDASNARGAKFWRKAGFVPVELVAADPDREPYRLME
jgi:RimJ/RimL family protein N-acetyltransferase